MLCSLRFSLVFRFLVSLESRYLDTFVGSGTFLDCNSSNINHLLNFSLICWPSVTRLTKTRVAEVAERICSKRLTTEGSERCI